MAIAELTLGAQPAGPLPSRGEFAKEDGLACAARSFCRRFFTWYNEEHRHSGIGLLTPAIVHAGHWGAGHST